MLHYLSVESYPAGPPGTFYLRHRRSRYSTLPSQLDVYLFVPEQVRAPSDTFFRNLLFFTGHSHGDAVATLMGFAVKNGGEFRVDGAYIFFWGWPWEGRGGGRGVG